MNLLIDWGNSRLKSLLIKDIQSVVSNANTLKTVAHDSIDDFIIWLEQEESTCGLRQVLIASVRSHERTQCLVEQLKAYCQYCFVASTSNYSAGISCAYSDYSKLGIDRWLGVLAAGFVQQTVAIIDIGSAITVDVVSGEGIHLGGQIIPGQRLILKSLQSTDQVLVGNQFKNQSDFKLGKSTSECVNFGVQQLIAAYLSDTIQQLNQRYQVSKYVFTGGGGKAWCQRLNSNPQLTLQKKAEFWPNIVFTGLAIEFLEKQ
jgi:type III pantothenate kinase